MSELSAAIFYILYMQAPLKQALTFAQQVSHLQNKGLIVNDTAFAEQYLHDHNYYHLNIYFHHYLDNNDRFFTNTTFEKIVEHEENDCWFRKTLFSALGSIEIKARTLIAYELAHNSFPDAFSNASNFSNPTAVHQMEVDAKNRMTSRGMGNQILSHHNKIYGGKLPVWVLIEYFSFGNLSRLYTLLNNFLQEEITYDFGFKKSQKVLIENWFHNLTVWRNICAHHGYLLHRKNDIRLKIHCSYPQYLGAPDITINKSIFASVSAIRLLLAPNEWNSFRNKLIAHENDVPSFQLSDYDFESNWANILPTR